MSDPTQILRSLGETGARAAVFTTYSISFRFFEDVVLPRLRSAGCRHVVLLVDAARFAEAANDPEGRPQQAGHHYSVIPVAAPGAFHPKLLLQVGERFARLWIGSHNLTYAGLNHNAEVTTVATDLSEDVARRLARQAWRAVRAWLPAGEIAEEAASGVERLAPWLAESDDAATVALPTVVFGTPSAPLWPQVRALLPPRVRRVTVVGPFFDERVAFLERLVGDLGPGEVRVGLVPGEAQFPAGRRHELSREITLVHAGSLRAGEQRYLHAKALLFEADDGTVLVTGSANPSAPAFLGGATANCEAVVVQTLDGDADPLGLRRLRDAPALTDTDWEQLPLAIRYVPGSSTIPVQLGTADNGAITLTSVVDGITEVVFVGQADEPLGATTRDGAALTRVPVPDAVALAAVRWLELRRDNAVVWRILVHHLRTLRRLCRTGAEQRLTEVLQSLETSRPDWVNLLVLLDPLLDQPVRTGTVTRKEVDPPAPHVAFASGGVEVDLDAGVGDVSYATEGESAEVMLYVHRRLGIAAGRIDRSEEELVGTDDEGLLAPERREDPDQRARVQGRFDRLTKKLAKRLKLPPSEVTADRAHERVPYLAAVLGLAHATVCHAPPRPRQPHDHLRFAQVGALERLLLDGVAAAFFRRDLRHAMPRLGERAEEVRLVPVLLAWLCCELRLTPPDPSRRGQRRVDDRELARRAAWLTLLPTLDDDHWSRLREKVTAADSSPDALAWYDVARDSAVHLRAVGEHPADHAARRDAGEPGDLVAFGRGVLRVVRRDVGGPSRKRIVQWLDPGVATASRMLDHGTILAPSAWRPPSA